MFKKKLREIQILDEYFELKKLYVKLKNHKNPNVEYISMIPGLNPGDLKKINDIEIKYKIVIERIPKNLRIYAPK